MAWDTENTKRQLLAASTTLFARHGYAATTMEAIGRESGVNKERVYSYFGSKSGLFHAVLDRSLTELLDGLPFEGEGTEAVGSCARALFDHFGEHPHLTRLLAWESLELPEAVAAERRAQHCARQVAALRNVLPGISRDDAEQLLLTLVTVATSWWTLSRVSETILTGDTSTAARREAFGEQARALAQDLLTRAA